MWTVWVLLAEISPTQLGPGGLSFHPHFLVAGLGLGKRREPCPAGYMSSATLISGRTLDSCLKLLPSFRTGWRQGGA